MSYRDYQTSLGFPLPDVSAEGVSFKNFSEENRFGTIYFFNGKPLMAQYCDKKGQEDPEFIYSLVESKEWKLIFNSRGLGHFDVFFEKE